MVNEHQVNGPSSGLLISLCTLDNTCRITIYDFLSKSTVISQNLFIYGFYLCFFFFFVFIFSADVLQVKKPRKISANIIQLIFLDSLKFLQKLT